MRRRMRGKTLSRATAPPVADLLNLMAAQFRIGRRDTVRESGLIFKTLFWPSAQILGTRIPAVAVPIRAGTRFPLPEPLS